MIWVGLLFAIMSMATIFSLRAGSEPIESRGTPAELVAAYRRLCAQCLMLSNYTRPGPYTLEAFILYLEGEFIQNPDAVTKGWLLNGLVIRLALRMGLHRDAKGHHNISIFHGEMRRRIWHLIVQIDLLLSFQVGLPSMIQGIQSDTALPCNLLDDDFSEQTRELPQARPSSVYTHMLYVISKGQLCYTFGRIVELANSISERSYSEVLELDRQLQQAYSAIPSCLIVKPLEESIIDPPEVIMQRYNIILLFHKSRCVLHRKFITKEDIDGSYMYSRNACMDSALEILHHQSAIYNAIQSGGPLSRDRWYISSLTIHDFLLAAMIIYLRLVHVNDAQHSPTPQDYHLIHVLQKCREHFLKSSKEMRDAKKAAAVLAILLNSLRQRCVFSRDSESLPTLDMLSSTDAMLPVCDGKTLPLATKSGANETPDFDVLSGPFSGGVEQNEELQLPDTVAYLAEPSYDTTLQFNYDDFIDFPESLNSLGSMIVIPSSLDWVS